MVQEEELTAAAILGLCAGARPWQDGERRVLGGSSSVIGFTSPAATMPPRHRHKPQNSWVGVQPHVPKYNATSAADGSGCVFNVLDFNAAGDGVTDDTKAFQATWHAACVAKSAVIEVPADYVFVVGQITFKGPCQPNLIFQVDGTIVPPSDLLVWARLPNKVQWLGFFKQVDMTLQGSGIIDGMGDIWWSQPCKAASHGTKRCPSPTAVKFYGCVNVIVRDISIQDSPQMHLKFDNCQQVQVLNISISSPAWSPNTDGIHLTNTGYALLENLAIAAGDDCISLQTGTRDVVIRDVFCGPGHGISIGGLGQGNSQACVANITVQDVLIQDTQNGVRIKTWQGGSGVVQHVTFSNITMSNVQSPIVINQFYCDAPPGQCPNQTDAVLISDVTFRNIRGTFAAPAAAATRATVAAVYFACSDTVPCRGITVEDVELVPAAWPATAAALAYCWNSYGVADPFSCSPAVCLADVPQVQQSFEYC